MEEGQGKPVRKHRGEAVILKILQDQVDSGLNIKSYCSRQGIAAGTVHRWKKKHNVGANLAPVGFASVQIVPEPIPAR